jgi:hypothetical protein
MHECGFFIADSAGKAARRLGIMQKIVERQPSSSLPSVALESEGKDVRQTSEREKLDKHPAPQAQVAETGPENIAAPPAVEEGLARTEQPAAQTPAESAKTDDLYRRLTTFLKGRPRN